MYDAHKLLNINDNDFDILGGILIAILKEKNVSK